MPAGHGTIPFFIDDLCHTLPFAFMSVLSIAVIEGSARPSATNRYPIVDILSFISVDSLQSPVKRTSAAWDGY